jgi:recombination protein RecT
MKTDGSDKDTRRKSDNQEDADRKTLQSQISKMADQFQNALPNKIGVERMMRIVMTAILNNQKLVQCEPNSFFGSLLLALQMGLEVNTPLGHAYLIPRWDKNAWGKDKAGFKCNFQMGYQGLLELCYRYGKYRQITAEVVYKGDDFDHELGSNQFIRHNQKWKSEEPIFVWALYELENGGQRFKVWTWDKVMKHAEHFSEAYDDKNGKWKFSAWSSNDESKESMAKKTVLHDLLKFAPKSVELSLAVSADEKSVIARPVTEGNETRFQFDVQPPPRIEAPNDDLDVSRQQAPAAEKAARNTSEKQEREPDPVTAKSQGKGTQGSNLFSQDEEAALEEQYQQQMGGVELPDFQ